MDDAKNLLHPDGRVHKDLMTLLNACYKLGERYISQRYNQWDRNIKADQAYIDLTRRDRKGKRTHPFETTVYIPISRAAKDMIITFWMNIFTRKRPIFTINGRGPEDVAPSKRMEVVIDYQLERQRFHLTLWSFLNNILRFSFGHIKNLWGQDIQTVIESGQRYEMLPFPHFEDFEEEKEVIAYEGPMPACCDPYFTFFDPRVPGAKFQSGQFLIYEYDRSLYYLKKQAAAGNYINVDYLERNYGSLKGSMLSDGTDAEGHYLRANRSSRKDTMGTTTPDADKDLDDKNPHFTLREYYVELIPQQYGLSESNVPQHWVFATIGNSVIIRAERSVYGSQFPAVQGEYDFDPHTLFSQSFYEGVEGMQDLLNWIYNSHMDNVRRFLNDTLIFNQLAIDQRDITKPHPAKVVRLRKEFAQAALDRGIPIASVIHQLQVADVTSSHMKDSEILVDLIQRRVHASDTMQGVESEVKRTATEIARTTTSGGNILSQMAMLVYAQALIPLVEQSVINNQRFLSEERYYRIIGDYAKDIITPDPNYMGGNALLVRRGDLQGYFDFPVNDGRLPMLPEEQAEIWLKALETMGKIPPVTMQYDAAMVFREFVRSMGIKNIDDFKINAQVMPNDIIARMAQAGNAVPIPQGGASPGMAPPGMR
jgi:hypothetical protein